MLQGEVPTGTVTFLLTDIQGSSKLWEAHPGLMRSSLATHDSLTRTAIAIASESGMSSDQSMMRFVQRSQPPRRRRRPR